jgi:hypothetical protein
MNTSTTHLTALQQTQLQTIGKIIIEGTHPEKIILYGVYDTTEGLPDFSVQSRITHTLGNYYILVLTKRSERRSEAEVLDIILNRCRSYMPVTVIVHDIQYVNIQLAEGRYFFTTVCQTGILLYDAETVPLIV